MAQVPTVEIEASDSNDSNSVDQFRVLQQVS